MGNEDGLAKRIGSGVRRAAQHWGYDVVVRKAKALPPDFSAQHTKVIRAVEAYTMTSPERLFALMEAVRYVVGAGIPGDFMECGVWRGGSSMAAALSLLELGKSDRRLFLFDTFEGMPKPLAVDTSYHGEDANETFEALKTGEDASDYCYAGLDEVRSNMAQTGYPQDRIQFVKGKVEDTIPQHAPEQIALLRLDTDWYESTKHELEHLYPRLSKGGVLIIDDYGHWQGCRKAVDEYFETHGVTMLLGRVDYTGRMGIKG